MSGRRQEKRAVRAGRFELEIVIPGSMLRIARAVFPAHNGHRRLHANKFARYASRVIDFDAARKIAGDHIHEGEMQYVGGPDGVLKPSFTPVIVDSLTKELDFGWVFFHDSEEHQKTGDFRFSLIGNAPIIVDRADGSIHLTGTARSLDYYVEEYKRKRQRG